MLRVLMILVPLALSIYAFIDCITTDEKDIKHIPKPSGPSSCCSSPGGLHLLADRRQGPRHGGPRPAGRTPLGRRLGRAGRQPDFLKSLKDDGKGSGASDDTAFRESWEEDLRRREEELKRRESKDEPRPKDPDEEK